MFRRQMGAAKTVIYTFSIRYNYLKINASSRSIGYLLAIHMPNVIKAGNLHNSLNNVG